jgi:hypothetical protein
MIDPLTSLNKHDFFRKLNKQRLFKVKDVPQLCVSQSPWIMDIVCTWS